MRDTPGSEAELELECLSNSSPAPGVCVSRNNKAVVQQGFRRVQSVRLRRYGQLYAVECNQNSMPSEAAFRACYAKIFANVRI